MHLGFQNRMRRGRNTKIVATLGPASSAPDRIKALFEAGADVFRVNMSHNTPDSLKEIHARVRALEQSLGRPIGILADLQGPKIRLGQLPGGSIHLKEGDRIKLVREVILQRPDCAANPACRSVCRAEAAPLPLDR